MTAGKFRTCALSRPQDAITVFLIEQRGALWHPVIELHDSCRGMTHFDCAVLCRVVARGFDSQASAVEALRAFAASGVSIPWGPLCVVS